MNKEWVFLIDKPLKMSYHQKLEEATWFKEHIHEGVELLYIHNGVGHVEINNEQVEIKDNLLLVVPPFKPHKISAKLSESQPYIRSMFLFQPQVVRPFFEGLINSKRILETLIRYPLKQHIYDMSMVSNELNELMDFYHRILIKTRPEEYNETYSMALAQFLKTIYPYLKFYEGKNKSSYLLATMEWIDDHINERFTLEKLANDVGLSKYYIAHFFKESLGITVLEYVNCKKLEKVKLLLRTTEQSIEWIGRSIGIEDPSYFSKWFKAQVNITPLQYKKNNAMHTVYIDEK